MNDFRTTYAVFFTTFCTAVGWCFNHPALGLTIGTGMVIVSTLIENKK